MPVSVFKPGTGGLVPALGPADLSDPSIIWIEMNMPLPEERVWVQDAIGLELPDAQARAALEESARYQVDEGVLVMQAELVARDSTAPGGGFAAPGARPSTVEQRRTNVSFVLTRARMVTVRDCPIRTFEINAGRASAQLSAAVRPGDVFAALVAGLVERAADQLLASGTERADLSRLLFSRGKRVGRVGLEATLRRIGQIGSASALARDSLASLARMTRFALANAAAFNLDVAALREREADLDALGRQAEALTADISFLLDATLGLVGARQNRALAGLSAVTLLFAPPTLIASVFGMNFAHFDALADPIGLPVSLAAMVGSSLALLAVGRWSRWF